MANKSLEALILKIVTKEIKKEIKNLNHDHFSDVATQINHQLPSFTETFATEEDTRTTAEIVDDIYTNGIVNFPTHEDRELERKLRELKFKQDLRKDWILFIVRDVIVYPATILFMFIVAGFYVFTLVMSK
ncbi:hypothetical protein A0J48_024055 [Sphaerospermopsis aphanizomenoides BCCUSP55]|uniref:hypothetical protein n=1 Tax=Sphaerospermopsis aphanizomenoides TaxID=459663 RepID=UPI00190806A0|nr:hypothetical protein [Sphaerospermopsis aphanizomenoides]MBK1990560.1 hypothetical protein [Sphaerospermopsis aphanizomenoides BCCUSP55]